MPDSNPAQARETATFGAGCFWCVEAVLTQVAGVETVRSGFMGGDNAHPSYREVCAGQLQPVLDTLAYVKHETEVWLETTTLLIPGLNDSNEELDAMTRWVVKELGPDTPMHFTAFHPDWRMLDRPATPPSTLTRARAIAIDNGVRYANTGNVIDEVGGTTSCHVCGEPIIRRAGYEIIGWGLDEEGDCHKCGAPCSGVFETEHGHWGSRRMPVRLAGYRP